MQVASTHQRRPRSIGRRSVLTVALALVGLASLGSASPALADSTDWKATGERMKALFEEWKTIGSAGSGLLFGVTMRHARAMTRRMNLAASLSIIRSAWATRESAAASDR